MIWRKEKRSEGNTLFIKKKKRERKNKVILRPGFTQAREERLLHEKNIVFESRELGFYPDLTMLRDLGLMAYPF